MRKLLAISSYDSKVPMSIQCNIKSFIGHLQDITTFVIVRCRRMKILKKTARFRVSNSQETQNK